MPNLTAAKLKIKNTPMFERKIRKIKRGKKWKMGFSQFLASLFRINEVNPRSKKMTDAEIARQVREEYSELKDISKRFASDNPELSRLISKYRSEYNRGRLITSSPPPEPKFVSFAYNNNGNAVNARYVPPMELTELEKRAVRARYKPYRDAYLDGKRSAAKVK